MAVLTRGRSILESLIGDSTLQEIFGGANKNEKNSPKVAQQQSPSSSTSELERKKKVWHGKSIQVQFSFFRELAFRSRIFHTFVVC
jgi:hypothetical protein